MRRGSRIQQLSACNRLLWPVLEVFRFIGRDSAECLERVGLSEDEVYASNGRITLEQLYKAWRHAVQVTGDRALGVKMAAFANPQSTVSWPMPLSLFEHLGLVSSTLAEGVSLHGRFIRLLRDGMSVGLELEGDDAMLRMEFPREEPPELIEHSMAIAVSLGRRINRGENHTREVWFTHDAPPNLQPHAKLFQAPVRYGAPVNGFLGSAAAYRRPLPSANAAFRDRIVRQAEQALLRLPTVDLFEDRVCAQIEAELPYGNTNATAISEKLGVSCRTLHRRLQQEGTSYQDLLDRVRFRLAVRYLSSGRAIGEVALLVGFAQPSTFHRAFKSWTGQTPAGYQGRQAAAPSP